MADEALRQEDMKKEKQIAKPVQPSTQPAPKQEVKKEEKVDKEKSGEVSGEVKEIIEDKKEMLKTDEKKAVESDDSKKKDEETKPKEKKAEKREVVKKDHAGVYGRNLPISLKHSKFISKFIKGKEIESAIRDLEKVVKKKQAVPMKGELPHRKGKGMMSGKYPVKASEHFIKLLKSLNSNSSVNGLDTSKTIIKEAIVNKAPDQMHRFGRMKFKRTHVKLKAMEVTKREVTKNKE